jgi:hypothetical protein
MKFKEAEELLQGSSEDEMFETPITKTFDSIHPDGIDIVFGIFNPGDLTSLHPSPVHIFQLWQTFLDNVDPLIKLFHAPSVQQRVLDATSDLENIPKDLEALMFGIYTMAVSSLAYDECYKKFNEDKGILVARYQLGVRQALNNAGYLKSTELTVLQAFTLYLVVTTYSTSL